MSTETALEQSASSTETATETPAFNAEAYENLTAARLNFAPAAEIERLEKLVNEPPAKVEETVTETPPTETTTEETKEEEIEPEVTEPEVTGETPKPEAAVKDVGHFRFRDATDKLVAQTARTLGISLIEAAARIAGTPVAKEVAEAIPNLPPPPDPELTALEQELTDVRAKLKADKADGVLATEELDTLEDRRAVLIVEIAQAKSAAKQALLVESKLSDAEFLKERTVSLKQTVLVYPEMAKTTSAQYRIAKAIGAEWRTANDPRLNLPEGARLIADEAAAQLGIKPVGEVVPPVKKPVAKETSKPGPAPGSRTSTVQTQALTAAQQAEESERQVQAVLEGRALPPPRPVRTWA